MQYGNPTIGSPRDWPLFRAPRHGDFQPQVQQGEPERRQRQAGAELIEVSSLPGPGPVEFYFHDAAD